MQEIIKLFQMTAKEGKEEDLKKALELLVRLTLKEPGCLAYEIWQDLKNQRSFAVYERFINEDALEKHVAMPYIVQFIENEYKTCVESFIDSNFQRI